MEARDDHENRPPGMEGERTEDASQGVPTKSPTARSRGVLRVLVCGGRAYEDRRALNRTLTQLHAEHPIGLVITGGAPGADRLGQRWAEHQRIPVAVYPANWQFVGRSAGPVRNGAMLEFGKPDVVVAFPGGRGTADMVSQATSRGVPVIGPVTDQNEAVGSSAAPGNG